MENLAISIIEDEVLIAENIAMHIRDMGHEVLSITGSYEAAMRKLAEKTPDFILIDIRLKGGKSGIDVARQLKETHNIPFLFLTSNTDRGTIQKAMVTNPIAYITKPFTYQDLFIAIELAKAKMQLGANTSRRIEIKNGTQIQWVSLDDILYLEAARAYVTIHLAEGSMVLRQSMGNLLAHFEERDMLRIHRSFAVNPRKVEGVSSAKVVISGKKLPLGPGYREEFLEWMRAV